MSCFKNVRAAEQDFLLFKLRHTAQLAISLFCWLFSQTINFQEVADWALN
jgi:hypothetical protein